MEQREGFPGSHGHLETFPGIETALGSVEWTPSGPISYTAENTGPNKVL